MGVDQMIGVQCQTGELAGDCEGFLVSYVRSVEDFRNGVLSV